MDGSHKNKTTFLGGIQSMNWGASAQRKQLLHWQLVWQWLLLYLLPDGSSVNTLWLGWVLSICHRCHFSILWVLVIILAYFLSFLQLIFPSLAFYVTTHAQHFLWHSSLWLFLFFKSSSLAGLFSSISRHRECCSTMTMEVPEQEDRASCLFLSRPNCLSMEFSVLIG